MKKRSVYLVFTTLLAASLLFAGCSSNDTADAGAGQEAGSADVAKEGATGETVDIVLTAKNFEFDQEVYEVPLGATVNVTIVNDEGYHTAMIEGYKVDVKPDNTMTFVADKAGEFQIICSTMCGTGHADMKSKLVVKN
jgi:cytochrome c oxidase subunit 2